MHGANPPWLRTAHGAGILRADGTVGATIFSEMTALASMTGAINLGQGFPDEPGPAVVLDAARSAIERGENQYPPGRGDARLRSAISDHQHRWYGLTVDPDTEIAVSAGATEAIAASILALASGPDDEVVVFEPHYDSYAATIALAGATLRAVPLVGPAFDPDVDRLREAVTDRTRVILINTPHNPTGTQFADAAIEEIIALAHRHNAVIVSDEVYEHLVFDGAHTPVASRPGAAGRTITISSGGKTFNTTGWKVGWASGPSSLITAVLTVKQFLSYSGGAPFQPAIAAGLALPDEYFAGIADTMGRRARALGAALTAAGCDVAPPTATYFTVADVAPLGFKSAEDFCRQLPELAGVVAIPVTAFVTPQHRSGYATLVRFAACKRDDVIAEAAARLSRLSPSR